MIRDQHTRAVLNTDVQALNKYKQERQLHRTIASLTKELNDMKECLARVCQKLDQIEKN